MRISSQGALVRYGRACVLAALAVLVRWLLDPLLGNHLPYPTLYGAVAAAVWLGGAGPAALAAAGGYVAANYLFVQPRGTLNFHDAANQFGFVAYAISCTLIIGFGEGLRAARLRAEAIAREALGGREASAREVAERARTEAALRQSEERFRHLAEGVPSIVWTAAPDGTITYANERWFRYCGITPEENARRWPELVLYPDDHDRCVAAWTRALAEGCEYEVEVRNRRHDGAYRWFVTRAIPLKDEAGRVLSWFGVTTDIHDLKELQAAQREAGRRKDAFLAVLGHELRNPLGPIRNAVQILQTCGLTEPAARQACEMIDRQLAHMVRLIDDLLDVSRIARGKVHFRKERCDLARIVRDTAEDYRAGLEAAGLRLSVAVPGQPLWVHGDTIRLAQVVGNILHNAGKFTDPGGEVTVTLGEAPGGGAAVLCVRDTGVGMEPEALARVFEAFSQAERSLDRSRGGLGLGLALVKGIVVLHGGTVAAASAGPGRGSEFAVRLPLEPVPVQPAPPAPVGAPHRFDRAYRILVIEDNTDAAWSLQTVLRLNGHQVEVAHDGPNGVAAAARFRPEVVICDIAMPGMDGYALARALRADPQLAGACLIALTGYGQDEDQRQAREAGFDYHMVKPVDFDELRQVLATQAPRNGMGKGRSGPASDKAPRSEKQDVY